MSSKIDVPGSAVDIRATDLKYGLIAIGTILSIPLCYVAVALFFTLQLIPPATPRPAIRLGLAVVIPVLLGYGVARRVGTVRAARWTAIITLAVGSGIGWMTVNAFRV